MVGMVAADGVQEQQADDVVVGGGTAHGGDVALHAIAVADSRHITELAARPAFLLREVGLLLVAVLLVLSRSLSFPLVGLRILLLRVLPAVELPMAKLSAKWTRLLGLAGVRVLAVIVLQLLRPVRTLALRLSF